MLESKKQGRTVDAGVRVSAHTLSEKSLKFGRIRAYKLATNNKNQGYKSKGDKIKNEKSKGFLMTPRIEWLHLELRWSRWLRVHGHANSLQKVHIIHIVASDFSIRSGFSMTLLLNDHILNAKMHSRTVDAGARMSAHTLNEQV